MLFRVIITAETVGATGQSTLSIAQILGVSDANNRRDRICSTMLFHDRRMVQVIEGARADVDRLLRRLSDDPRLSGLMVIGDMPIAQRRLTQPVSICREPGQTLAGVGLPGIERLAVGDVEAMLDYRRAA